MDQAHAAKDEQLLVNEYVMFHDYQLNEKNLEESMANLKQRYTELQHHQQQVYKDIVAKKQDSKRMNILVHGDYKESSE